MLMRLHPWISDHGDKAEPNRHRIKPDRVCLSFHQAPLDNGLAIDFRNVIFFFFFTSGPHFALYFVILTLESWWKRLEMFETLISSNHDLCTPCQKKWSPKILLTSAETTLKWDLQSSEFLSNIKYMRELRRIHWKKQVYFCYFSLLPLTTLICREYISHELQRQFKKPFSCLLPGFFQRSWTPSEEGKGSKSRSSQTLKGSILHTCLHVKPF